MVGCARRCCASCSDSCRRRRRGGVSELARNQISHAGGGTIQLVPQLAPKRLLRVSAEDSGQGIPDLERVLSGTYKRKTGLGLLGVKRLADRFDVRTGPKGTQVDFEVWL
ncbi:ATP-binding protein [Myxococcus sp. AM009]|uniref:ATP-binding protein n=1 Tax=Myxococcus sp. AM009 TaxID=2745137 RepID=UPI0034D18F68